MTFKVGDKVELTGSSWPERETSELPARGSVVEVTWVDNYSGGFPRYGTACGRTDLWISEVPVESWGGILVSRTSEPTPVNPRTEGLNQAISLIDGDRQGVYGDPLVSHERIAKLWSALLGVEINAHQVAMMMAAMKLSRLAGQAEHKDSWVDLAGYAGLGYEFVVRKGE